MLPTSTKPASSLVRYLHRRHHLRLFQQFRQKITSTRTLLNFLWYIRPCTPLQSSQFNHIQSLFDYDFFFSFEKCISFLFGDQIETQSQASIPSTRVLLPLLLPRHSNLRTLRFAGVFSPGSLFWTDLRSLDEVAVRSRKVNPKLSLFFRTIFCLCNETIYSNSIISVFVMKQFNTTITTHNLIHTSI